jgi:hypothetical protein
VKREAVAAAIAVAATAACGSPPILASDIDAIVDLYKPLLDDLARRVQQTKHTIRDTMPEWQHAARTAEAASDELGLPPYTQTVPPGPGYTPPPSELIGMGLEAKRRAAKLEASGDTAQLAPLLADVRRRYVTQIIHISARLDLVEWWVAHPGPFPLH